MDIAKARKRFEANYCEEVRELLVLTSESVGGAGLYEKGVWQPSAGLLAVVDPATGGLSEGKGCLYWLVEEKDKKDWVFDIRPLTVYRIRCRERLAGTVKAGAGPFYMLVEVLDRGVSHSGLERVLEEYRREVVITDELCGSFVLERRFDWFGGDVDWLGEECSVSLACDEEGGETAADALAAFRGLYEDLEEWDGKFRTFAAKELTELANEWQESSEEEEPEPITEEEFAKRMQIGEFSMETEGDFTAYYEDDDMFFGHVILVEGNLETGIERANIAG